MRVPKSLLTIVFGGLLLVVAAWISGRTVWNTPSNALVVYCAHDAEYSEPILKEFERRTGIPVLIRFDTEATKSLGLVNLLIQEKSQPRCDVFWNNELLGMLDLQAQGVLTPYQGSGYQRIPLQYKDRQGYWTGFAARLRVHIVNTDEMQPDPVVLDKLWDQEQLDRVAIAKPLYGTTLVHYSVLADLWGIKRLQEWHRQIQQRGVQVVNGNGTVKNLVAEGACRAGLTDTDDFFAAQAAGKPVAMVPVRVGDRRQTICIPNTVAMIQGTRRTTEAKQLIDFLLSKETELKLALSTAHQVPLGETDPQELPARVRELAELAKDGYDLRGLGIPRQLCVSWLTEEYLQRPATGAASP